MKPEPDDAGARDCDRIATCAREGASPPECLLCAPEKNPSPPPEQCARAHPKKEKRDRRQTDREISALRAGVPCSTKARQNHQRGCQIDSLEAPLCFNTKPYCHRLSCRCWLQLAVFLLTPYSLLLPSADAVDRHRHEHEVMSITCSGIRLRVPRLEPDTNHAHWHQWHPRREGTDMLA